MDPAPHPSTTLRDLLSAGGTPPPLAAVVALAEAIARAAEDLHREGRHGELRPESLVLDTAGTVRIAGSAPPARGACYLGPEQIAGGPATAASDQFALAAIVAEVATGRAVFPGVDPDAARAAAESCQTGPARRAAATRSPSLAAALSVAMERRPAGRFSSCSEFASRLRARVAPEASPADLRAWATPLLGPAEGGAPTGPAPGDAARRQDPAGSLEIVAPLPPGAEGPPEFRSPRSVSGAPAAGYGEGTSPGAPGDAPVDGPTLPDAPLSGDAFPTVVVPLPHAVLPESLLPVAGARPEGAAAGDASPGTGPVPIPSAPAEPAPRRAQARRGGLPAPAGWVAGLAFLAVGSVVAAAWVLSGRGSPGTAAPPPAPPPHHARPPLPEEARPEGPGETPRVETVAAAILPRPERPSAPGGVVDRVSPPPSDPRPTPGPRRSTAAAAPPASRSEPPGTTGPAGLPPASTVVSLRLREVIGDAPGVRACLAQAPERGILKSEDLVTVRLQVRSDGIVSSAVVAGDAEADTALAACLSDAIRGARFAPFQGPLFRVSTTLRVP
ncbi:hypothetical protein L6R50_14325 [Myxococcota bacterium]|nr:hypothetical protein [Myxococcota bacterium]